MIQWVEANKLFFMNNQLSNTKAADYASNQDIAKSQKILNRFPNFHIKTELPEKNEDDHRSPENNRGDLRDTWRKPRMPYNKLPDAFQIKPKKKKTNKELLDNIDKIVKYNEYKQIQKYLEPIPLEKKSEEKPRDFVENSNPLATYQKYLKIKSKFTEQIQEKDLSIHKYKPLSIKQTSSSIRITDCITLQVIKRGHNTGTIKKMLHVPTLKLVCIRQEPLNTKESRHAIKDWLMLWQNKLNNQESKRYISVYGTFYNMPEGAVSIITEYSKYGSLLNLLDTVITLPESVIREIFVEVFESLGYYYENSDHNHFGGISPSQIMLTDQGKIKIGLGLYYHISSVNSNSLYSMKLSQKANIFEFNTTQKHFMKSTLEKSSNTELQRSLDIFKLGLMMLECAIGGFQKYQQSSIVQESIKNVFTEDGQKLIERQSVCCLLHSEAYLLQNYSQDQRSRRDKIQVSKITFYMKFLKDRFSMPFINFLCQCLKLNHSKRSTFRELISHSFLRNQTSKDTKTVVISLNDLLQINNDWNQEFIESTQQQRLDKFIGHVLQVLNDCRRQVVVDLLTNCKNRIMNLAQDIGLNYHNLGERLYAAMAQMVKLEKKEFTTSI